MHPRWSAFSVAVVATIALACCGGHPIVGTWSGTDLPVSFGPLTFKVDATATFDAKNATVALTIKDDKGATTGSATSVGTYTIDAASKPEKLKLKIESVTATDAQGAALVATNKNAGTSTEAICFKLSGIDVCIYKNQEEEMLIANDTLSTRVKADVLTVPLTLKRATK